MPSAEPSTAHPAAVVHANLLIRRNLHASPGPAHMWAYLTRAQDLGHKTGNHVGARTTSPPAMVAEFGQTAGRGQAPGAGLAMVLWLWWCQQCGHVRGGPGHLLTRIELHDPGR
jgi:hypothetical protein